MAASGTDDPHAPIEDAAYQVSLGVNIQGVMDNARRVRHVLGLRPYKVFLVWEQRGADRVFHPVRRIELLPVRISALDDIDLTLTEVGIHSRGSLVMDEISPNQVTEDDLRGRFDGASFNGEGQQFYVEVVQQKRRPDDPSPKPQRYITSSQPYYDADRFWWQVSLQDQEAAPGPGGKDRTVRLNPDKDAKLKLLSR